MGVKQATQLDLFGLFNSSTQNETSTKMLVSEDGAKKEEDPSWFQFFSHRISASTWVTSFQDKNARSASYIDAVSDLSDLRRRIERLSAETQNNPHPSLALEWREVEEIQQSIYLKYSGEGGLPISNALVRAHLTFLQAHHSPIEQRRLLLAGLHSYLGGTNFSGDARGWVASIVEQLKTLSSGEISTARIHFLLNNLEQIESATGVDSGLSENYSLNSEEGNGAYYSPELFQELLRLIPLTALSGQEINVLEPNVGKGSLIRPLVHKPGVLIFANDLNPISAEVTALTTMVNPSRMAQSCENKKPLPIASNCIVAKMHAFRLTEALPDDHFDLLIANPPYIFDEPAKRIKQKFNAMGLKSRKEGISLTEFTRKILPMKLREGGISIMITSSRSNNFKRVKHDNGTLSHPIMVLGISGQAFSLNDANLLGVSMPAYSFEDGALTEKKQIKAECFISINVLASSREVTGKTASFSECDLIHLDVKDLPMFVQHCLSPRRWQSLEHRVLGPSMQMLQTANVLRLFHQVKAAALAHLEAERQAAKRRYQPDRSKQLEKSIQEVKTKRFSQIPTFNALYTWVQVLEKRWRMPLQEPITGILKKNPLRKFLSKQGEDRTVSPEVEDVVRRASRSALSTSNRVFSRCYLYSSLFPIETSQAISRLYGPYNGLHFTTDHPVLGRVPYPFSLYILKDREIVRILQAFPEIEQKAVLGDLKRKTFDLNRNVARFNLTGRRAEEILQETLGGDWYQNLLIGTFPKKKEIQPLLVVKNPFVQGIGHRVLSVIRQYAIRRKEINEAMEEMKFLEKQRQYRHYLKGLTQSPMTAIKFQNLLGKTRSHIDEIQQGIKVLEAPDRPIRKIRQLSSAA